MTRRKTWGIALFVVGLVIAVGPIALFFFMATFPKLFDNDAIALVHIVSAFGFVVYVPVGGILAGIGAGIAFSSGANPRNGAVRSNRSLERGREG